MEARVIIVTPDGTEYIWQGEWKKPRDWELYFVLSSHTDIGLHNSQYVQRYQSANFIDKAIEMEAQAEQMTPQQPYHYMVEGTWIWNNYAADHGKAQAEKVRDEYILPGKFGVFSGIAGNFVQVFGLEEMCRCSYVRRELKDQWGIDSRTMAMIDNNGLSACKLSYRLIANKRRLRDYYLIARVYRRAYCKVDSLTSADCNEHLFIPRVIGIEPAFEIAHNRLTELRRT